MPLPLEQDLAVARGLAIRGLVLCVLLFAACDDRPRPPLSPSPPIQPSPVPPNPGTFSSTMAGEFSLELNVGSGCPALPSEARIRRYSAKIEDAAAGRYLVTLRDSIFLTGLICTLGPEPYFRGIGCHQFYASEDIDTASFFLQNNNDDAHGGHIVEQLPSGAWMEITGGASGRLHPSSIDATGTGNVWFCRTPSNYPFPCGDVVSCRSDDMRMTFTRQ